MSLIIPLKAVMEDSVLERQKGMKGMGMERVSRRELAGKVSAGALVSENP